MQFCLVRCTVALSAALGVVFTTGCLPQPVPTPVVSPSPPAAPGSPTPGSPAAGATPAGPLATTYRELADRATQTLLQQYFDPRGGWKLCPDPVCPSVNRDWGADSLTYALYLRWKTTRDATLVPTMDALVATAPVYPPPCRGVAGLICSWSDVANWDAVAEMREFEPTGGNLRCRGRRSSPSRRSSSRTSIPAARAMRYATSSPSPLSIT